MKHYATSAQIKAIKEAIKRHKMVGLTWQSVASRPATIEEFLKATGAE
jgi:hypothetical protein